MNIIESVVQSMIGSVASYAGSKLPAFLKFFLNPLTLSDTYGNVAEAMVRNSTATVLDYQGVLQTMPINMQRVEGGRWDGTAWHNTLPDGVTLLHPHKSIEGASTPWVYPAYATATAIPAGGFRFDAGKYYSTALGGTTAGATLLTDTGVTDWVEAGLYNPRYGLVAEDSSSNSIPAWKWRNSSAWIGGWNGAGVTAAQQNDGSLSIDGTLNGDVVLTSTSTTGNSAGYMQGVPVPNDSATHSVSVLVRKGSATNTVQLQVLLLNGTTVSSTVYMDTVTGKVAAWSNINTVESAGAYWRVTLPITNNTSGNTVLYAVVAPAYSAAVTSGFDATLTGSVTVDWPQVELNAPIRSSLMAGGSTRATELGNYKWSTANLPTSGKLTWWMGWQPDFASGDLAATNKALLVFNGAFWPLWQTSPGTTSIKLNDGTNPQTVTMPAWNAYDAIELITTADDTTGKMQLHYRNVTQNTAWVHSALTNYDGAFTDTGFAQLFKGGGKNNSNVHALMGWSENKSSAWIEGNLP
ncbi:MAG: hypothetical protein R8K20_11945 [Gallionellaceae bacterium]